MKLEFQDQFRRGAIVGALEAVCERFELTEAQKEQARTRYEGVGRWLSESSHPALAGILIYVQGSAAIGTTVRPYGHAEHDVDLIAKLEDVARHYPPAFVKKLIGDRLKEHGTYERLLEEMCRCWRIDYANEFHLDITPSVPNPSCPNGGELVPDKELHDWKPSNPKGYKALFERRAAMQPTFALRKTIKNFDDRARATVEPYPEHHGFKGLLRRSVQISKRHRDIYFAERPGECAPISVIVTTLLSRSYEWCVKQRVYDDELDLLVAVIGHMTDFISLVSDRWYIWNETTANENFAEKWNAYPDRAKSFFMWHAQLVADLDNLRSIEGLDRMAKSINDAFGPGAGTAAVGKVEQAVSDARNAGSLRYGVGGLVGAATAACVTTPTAAVARNTFFGR
ncbi:MAG: nucleotidyltransferase [Alphaproteobacteria bacterium]|nr:MAG: nucleotidyltransferase [Alphaproteobacteria bacterium]